MPVPLALSQTSRRCPESPITFFMRQALENPAMISLAAGLVDTASLPSRAVKEAVAGLMDDPATSKAALQYGTTQGHPPLRRHIMAHLDTLDGRKTAATADHVVVSTGSQQLLYLLGEILFDAGDIVITEAPSYFVYHAVLASRGVRVETVPMDDGGMDIDALAKLLGDLEARGELAKVKLIYTVDYFQNPTGLTLSESRRHQLMKLVKGYADRHRILVLEDAAYRELQYEGPAVPSIKSLDAGNEYVVYAGTFSKPCSPGLKTGYAVMPEELVEPLVRLKGNHDFGSGNLAQYVITRLMESGEYHSQVAELRTIYRAKRDAMLETLRETFGTEAGVEWTHPLGGMFVWLRLPEGTRTGIGSAMAAAAFEEGVIYVPGEFSHIAIDGERPTNEMRLSFGDATIERIREGVRRLHRGYASLRKREAATISA